ncbi:MAG: SUMF1/EgtB/PvdO family nonheme iron enzyme [Opitutales bacterium]|nr:SUMF1/EgtB/PvdO family nonheme iron enzyme [Opitutales bacterium]
MKTRLLLLSMISAFASAVNAAAPVVTGVSASQRTNTKIVDITYNLTLDAGQKAFVELWFSPDNGLNYPIRCLGVTGDVDSNVSGGTGKTVEWNAESDWNQQFTANGKIRVIGTYGDQPSGFAGSGSGGNTNNNYGQADASMMTANLDTFDSPIGDKSSEMKDEAGVDTIKVDPTEITNEKWNQVVVWALANGYSGLPMGPEVNATHPRTDVSFWEAVKWSNARSEMDGLIPAYSTTEVEVIFGDFNNDGVFMNKFDQPDGPDDWDNFSQDTNNNGRYDPGEPYTDSNGNGKPDLDEYEDFNGDNVYNAPTPYRTGTHSLSGKHFFSYIDFNATGYRLIPPTVIKKLASGGVSGKQWPWGDESPEYYGNFASEYHVSVSGTPLDGPSPATARPANGYGLKDLIGNVGEHVENAGLSGSDVYVYGGSYLGLRFYHPDPTVSIYAQDSNFFELGGVMDVNQKSPAIGFRCMVKSE